MKKHLLLLAMFIIANSSYAQESTNNEEKSKISVITEAEAGYTFYNLSSLNSFLATESFSPFSSGFYQYGIEVKGLFWERIYLGGEVSRIVNPSTSSSSFNESAYLNGSRTLIHLGYSAKLSNRFTLNPDFGVGLNQFRLSVQNSASPPDFSSAFNTNKSVTLSALSSIFQAAIGVDVLAGKSENKSRYKIGLQIGYQFDGGGNWESDKVTLSNGPTLSASGFFFRVNVGNIRKF